MTIIRRSLAIACLPFVAACAGAVPAARDTPPAPQQSSADSGQSPAAQVPPTDPLPPRPRARPDAPAAQQIAGLETVLGLDAAQLIAMFGDPRLDVTEGDVRKLQWVGAPCVLDIYLYPNVAGGQLAAYIDARRASDGLDVDRVACVAALGGGQ